MWTEETFIVESNKIDPQYDLKNQLVLGNESGTPMYDNQKRALEIIPSLIANNPLPQYLIHALHRELTRNIDFFEERGLSGRYRNCNVYIGGMKAPAFYTAIAVIEEILIPAIQQNRNQHFSSDEALRFAWWCHDLFECAHPYIDGNGRTGRLLLNSVLDLLGHERQTVYYAQRECYYGKIKEFRQKEFPKILASMHDS